MALQWQCCMPSFFAFCVIYYSMREREQGLSVKAIHGEQQENLSTFEQPLLFALYLCNSSQLDVIILQCPHVFKVYYPLGREKSALRKQLRTWTNRATVSFETFRFSKNYSINHFERGKRRTYTLDSREEGLGAVGACFKDCVANSLGNILDKADF